ncbi:hypothetical protein LTR12_003627 [Friedmanniomyces endolithicus]|nr:hypothetical protein LTR12_003627 [Friedmanniomyces endolithicus]
MAPTDDSYEMQASRTDARFSTYSGAPSLQPSLAPTLDTQATSHRASTQPRHQYIQTSQPNEKSGTLTHNDTTSSSRMYSAAPAARESSSALSSSDPKAADLKSWSGTLERMQDVRLDKQRYVMSGNKSDELQCTHPHDSSLKIPRYIFSTTRTATNLYDLFFASQWPPEHQSPWATPDSNDGAEDIHWRYHTNEPIAARDELTDAISVPTNPFKKVYDRMAINSLMEYRVDASQTRARRGSEME